MFWFILSSRCLSFFYLYCFWTNLKDGFLVDMEDRYILVISFLCWNMLYFERRLNKLVLVNNMFVAWRRFHPEYRLKSAWPHCCVPLLASLSVIQLFALLGIVVLSITHSFLRLIDSLGYMRTVVSGGVFFIA